MRRDVYKEVTQKIIEALKKGTRPWVRPFRRLTDMNGLTGRPYRGINVLLLWLSSMEKGFTSPYWLTFNEAKKLGGHVRKGERGTQIIFWKILEVEQKDEDGNPIIDPETGEPETVGIPFARFYTVFNYEQTEGVILPKKLRAEPPKKPNNIAASLFELPVLKWGKKCCYHPKEDFIELPPKSAFRSEASFWESFFHELIHWTGPRLRRDLSGRFGSEAYAMEELIAEIGAGFLCARVGIPCSFEQNASYLSTWLKVLKKDSRAIFTCARKAQEAVDWLFKQIQANQENNVELKEAA